MIRLLHHIRRNTVAYLALFVALAGTSYAALRIPANSVGERELKNHSIDPIKLDPGYLGGYVRKWATVDASGHVIASGGRVRVTMPNYLPPAHYVINWLTKPRTSCSSIVSIDQHVTSNTDSTPGFVTSGVTQNGVSGVVEVVATFAADGSSAALPFDIALLC